MKISISDKRKAGLVTNFGHYPFARVEDKHHGVCFIPDGFQVEFYSHKMNWIGNIRVNDDKIVSYQCISKRNQKIASEFHNNPSAAYREVNEKEQNPFYKKSSNGALLFGITYPNFQREIRARFHTLTDDYGLEEEETREENEVILTTSSHDLTDAFEPEPELFEQQYDECSRKSCIVSAGEVFFTTDKETYHNALEEEEEQQQTTKRQRGMSTCSYMSYDDIAGHEDLFDLDDFDYDAF